ncbi:MAG: D-inositol-3-phosphate glycosyltransferase [Acidobacteria bacterium]|nr:D-inositol-3-phosphate glycosyltransferase [Acidobacteriota bacterium]
MRIGVDATCWQNNRGYGRHARALLSALTRLDEKNRYVFFLDTADALAPLPPQAEARIVRAAAPAAVAASANGHRSARDMWRMSRALADPDMDLLLFPTIYSYVPVFSRAKKIVMIHDVIAETYPQLTLPHPLARLFWRAKVAMGRRQADAIVTVSEYSRQGIARRFNLSPERVSVVGEASDPIFRRLPDAGLDAGLTPRLEALGVNFDHRTIVYVGGFSPHKNLEALVAAFAKLAAQPAFRDIRLALVGEYEKEVFHSYFGVIRQQVEKQGIADRVIFTGYLPDEELVVLLNCATALALPSLIEGFGLPAVEAAACGCPVIATTASPLPELLGDGGIFIDPRNQAELEDALVRVLESESLRRKMREAGLAAAGRLTWDAAARQMMALIQKVAAQ